MSNEISEKLTGLLYEARNSEMAPEVARGKLNDAFDFASRLSLNAKIINTEGTIRWINALVHKLLTDRDVRPSDLSCYCKVMLELLDPDLAERFSHPRPTACS